MEVLSGVKKLINDNKKKLVTEKDAYELWNKALSLYSEGKFIAEGISQLMDIFISSGVHFEKYVSDKDIYHAFDNMRFTNTVELHFDSVTSITYGVTYLESLDNVKAMYFPNCEHLYVGDFINDCPDLEAVYMPKCEDVDVTGFGNYCSKLEIVECPGLRDPRNN